MRYLQDLDSGLEAGRQIGIWMTHHNEELPHTQPGGDGTPMEVYNLKLAP